MRHALPALTRYALASLGNALQVNSTLQQLNLIDNDVNQQHGEFFAGSPCQVQLLQRRFGMNARPSSDVRRQRENADSPVSVTVDRTFHWLSLLVSYLCECFCQS